MHSWITLRTGLRNSSTGVPIVMITGTLVEMSSGRLVKNNRLSASALVSSGWAPFSMNGPGPVDVENGNFTVHNPTALGAETPLPVLVAALGPVMLQLAGEHADGTVLWMADEKAIGDHIAPKITKAAADAGRPAPRIVAGIPVCLCANSEIDAAKERANRILSEAETSPNYQKLLDRGDARSVGDLCAAGDEDSILARFKQFADAGVTDLSVRLLPIGDTRDELIASKYRTREVIGELAKAVR